MNDQETAEDLGRSRKKALEFWDLYKGKLNSPGITPEELLKAFKLYESIHKSGLKVYQYAYLYYSSDVRDHHGKILIDRVFEKWNEIEEIIAFFELELMSFPDAVLKRFIKSEDLHSYRHYLINLIKRKPYTLNEREEKILRDRYLAGKRAFVALYDDIMASLKFTPILSNKKGELHSEEIRSLFHSHDPEVREKAYNIYHEQLGGKGRYFQHILNALLLDHYLEGRERGYGSPKHGMILKNELDESIVDGVMSRVESQYALVRNYYRLKARALGQEKLRISDLFAPLEESGNVSLQEAGRFIINAVEQFNSLFGSIIREVFDENRIDAELREGKMGGGFCKCLGPSQLPFISVHYSGNLSDLFTMAHELGHAVHYKLASKQTYLNFRLAPFLEETAAIFFELVLFSHLIETDTFKYKKSEILAAMIESIIKTIFRQNVITRFEQSIHRSRQDHLLSDDEICRNWWDQNEKLYGESVDMFQSYRWGWAGVPHLFHHPFYCFNYIPGNLLALAFFIKNKEDSEFLKKIMRLFMAGSSRSPREMLNEMGFNYPYSRVWGNAMGYLSELINEFEQTV